MISLPRLNLSLAFVPLALATLSGCVTTSGEGSPRYALEQSLKSDPHASKMKPAALRKAVSAEINALGNAQPGTLNDWTGARNASGTVIPGTPFEISGNICRRYEHKITVEGMTQSRIATACRDADGIWKPLS